MSMGEEDNRGEEDLDEETRIGDELIDWMIDVDDKNDWLDVLERLGSKSLAFSTLVGIFSSAFFAAEYSLLCFWKTQKNFARKLYTWENIGKMLEKYMKIR